MTTETFTVEEQVFTGSTDCTGGGGPVVTVHGVDAATGHSIQLAPTDSVLFTIPLSPVNSTFDHISEQNGPFVGWNPDAASMSLATYPPGGSQHICARGPDDTGPHNFFANFYAGIQFFDSCGNERYAFRPGETVQVKVTGGVTFNAEPQRLQAAGGSPNECGVVPVGPDFSVVHVDTDPFTYSFTLPASDAALPSFCSPGTTHVEGLYRVVTYDVPGCGCNRNDVRFQVQADAPLPSCPLAGCPADIEQSADASSCGAVVNYAPPSASPGDTVNCDQPTGSTFPVGTTTVTCTATPGACSCSFQVTVNDTTSPTISAPPPVSLTTGSGASSCGLVVDDLSLGSATASDNCSATVTRPGVTDGNFFPVGTTEVIYTATDPAGHTASATQNVTVIDGTPPVVTSLSASPNILWPPNHSMQGVALSYNTSDNCGAVNCVVASVASNEPVNSTGDGDTAPDWLIVDSHHVRLRAERAGAAADAPTRSRSPARTLPKTRRRRPSRSASPRVKASNERGGSRRL